jgi:hypothetical protein
MSDQHQEKLRNIKREQCSATRSSQPSTQFIAKPGTITTFDIADGEGDGAVFRDCVPLDPYEKVRRQILLPRTTRTRVVIRDIPFSCISKEPSTYGQNQRYFPAQLKSFSGIEDGSAFDILSIQEQCSSERYRLSHPLLPAQIHFEEQDCPEPAPEARWHPLQAEHI